MERVLDPLKKVCDSCCVYIDARHYTNPNPITSGLIYSRKHEHNRKDTDLYIMHVRQNFFDQQVLNIYLYVC
jgi:hypothetical protein